MPLYEYRCRECDTTFEARRSAAEADAEVSCPSGHAEVRRLLSIFATAGRAAPTAVPTGSGGGCCGGSCGCR